MNKKILVLMGGISSEREVSLNSGKKIAVALRSVGYNIIEYDFQNGLNLSKFLLENKPDVVFNALHGNWGEDGTIQGFLDIMQIPYTHSDAKSSAVAMDKNLTKTIAIKNNIKTAPYETMTYKEFLQNGTTIPIPYVIKPVEDGSSVGVFIIKKSTDLTEIKYKDEDVKVLIEKFIKGKELTCTVINEKTYVVTELVSTKDFYNYEAKYNEKMTTHLLPADISEKVSNKIRLYSLKIHKALGCGSISRSDFRYNDEDGVIFLEINTQPGMTKLSLAPEQASYAGISYEELCKTLVENASCKKIQ